MIVDLLRKISSLLEENGIPYMLSGSVALGFYTIARTTRDIDIIVELNQPDVDKFLAAFHDFFLDDIGIVSEVKRKGIFNIIDKATAFKIDFIIRNDSPFGINEFSRRKCLSLDELNIWVVSLEDLIISKLKWIQDYQSDRQMNDIKNLLLNPEVDRVYLEDWIQKLKLKTFDIFENE